MNKFRFITSKFITHLMLAITLSFFISLVAIANMQQYGTLINTADSAMRSENYKTAIENYEKALEYYPNEPTIHNNLGVAYSNINDLKNAELHYKKAVEFDAENSLAYSNLGNLYERQEKYAEAAKYLEKYSQLNPTDKEIYFRLCRLYAKAGDKAENKAEYNDLSTKYGELYLKSTDDKFNTYLILGESCKKSRDFEKATIYYEKALNSHKTELDRKNLPYIAQQLRECEFRKRANGLIPTSVAPEELHKLVRKNANLKKIDTIAKLHEMIDFMWADENGKMLLSEIMKYKIPIVINCGGKGQTNAKTEVSYKPTPYRYVGMVPMPWYAALPLSIISSIFHPEVRKQTDITINLGEDVIQMYKDPKSSFYNNMYGLMSIMHESAHAVCSAIEDGHRNSLEEELTISMMGYNFASNVLLGHYLSRAETNDYAKMSFKSLMSDEHRELPLYTDFRHCSSDMGFVLHNYEIYENLDRIKQQALQ